MTKRKRHQMANFTCLTFKFYIFCVFEWLYNGNKLIVTRHENHVIEIKTNFEKNIGNLIYIP